MSNDGNSSSGFPSLTALLGLLAVAGYQHRDQISDWFRNNMGGGQDASQPGAGQANAVPGQQQGGGGLLGGLGGLLGAGGAGAILNSGLGELVDRFNQSGQGDKANSWVGSGPNQDVAPGDLEQALLGLGYKENDVRSALREVSGAEAPRDFDSALRSALSYLSGGLKAGAMRGNA